MNISIIIPVYNTAAYLPQLFECLQTQTMSDFEVIFVDDGSSDNSVELLHQFELSSKQPVRIFTQSHQYAAAARNFGIKQATGTYIIFIDSDDFVEPDYLEKLYSNAVDNNADLGICNMDQFQVATNSFEEFFTINTNQIPPVKYFNRFDLGEYLFIFCTPPPCNKIYRRQFLLEHNIEFQIIRHSEDFLFSKLCLLYAARICYIGNEPLYHYRRGMTQNLQATRSVNTDCEADSFLALRKILEDQNLFNNDIQLSYYNCLIMTFYWRIFEGSNHPEEFNQLYNLLITKLLVGVESCSGRLRPKNFFIYKSFMKMRLLPDTEKLSAFQNMKQILEHRHRMLFHVLGTYGIVRLFCYYTKLFLVKKKWRKLSKCKSL